MMVILIPYIIDPMFMYCGFSSNISFGRKEEKNVVLGKNILQKVPQLKSSIARSTDGLLDHCI